MARFGKLLRFKNTSGQVFYGEAKDLPQITKDALIGAEVPVFSAGQEPWSDDFKLSGSTEKIAEVRMREHSEGLARSDDVVRLRTYHSLTSRSWPRCPKSRSSFALGSTTKSMRKRVV